MTSETQQVKYIFNLAAQVLGSDIAVRICDKMKSISSPQIMGIVREAAKEQPLEATGATA